MGSRRLDNSEQHAQLLHILDKFFSEGEIHELAFKLGVDFENLPGDRKIDKAQSLIYYLSRRGRLGKLVTADLGRTANLPWMGGRATLNKAKRLALLAGGWDLDSSWEQDSA